jgi:hypothetical protein
MDKTSTQDATNPTNGLMTLEITTYPPPDRGIAAAKIEYPSIITRATIPTTKTAITPGGIPANHRFSGNGAEAVNTKICLCHPWPIVNDTAIIIAVNGPTSLISPVFSLANDFLTSAKSVSRVKG